MTTNSNDSKKRAKELQIPAQQGTVRKQRPASGLLPAQQHRQKGLPMEAVRHLLQKVTAAVLHEENLHQVNQPVVRKRKKAMTKKKKFKTFIHPVLAIVFVLSIASIVAAKYAVPAIKAMNQVGTKTVIKAIPRLMQTATLKMKLMQLT